MRQYEDVRAAALEGRAGLGAALLTAQGTAAWMRGWRACTPAPVRPGPAGNTDCRADGGPASEVVGVLAAMALACAVGGG